MTEEMKKQEERCRKIVGAVVRRAEKVCPGSLALIGVYGSFAAGLTHPWSDLELLILINDEAGTLRGYRRIYRKVSAGLTSARDKIGGGASSAASL